jgi:hypothetical protein
MDGLDTPLYWWTGHAMILRFKTIVLIREL